MNTALNRAIEVPRSTLLSPRVRNREERINWVLDYTPMSNRRVIQRHWHLLKDIPGCSIPLQIGFRRTRNLRNVLVRSDIACRIQHREDNLPKGHFKCGHCKVCHLIMEDPVVPVHGRDFRIQHNFFSTCSTGGVVYLLKCTYAPPLLYVGKTMCTLRTRLLEHQSHLRLRIPEAPLVDHFNFAQHSEHDLRHTVLYVGQKQGDSLENEPLRSEAFWIFFLNTTIPDGMNVSNDLSCYL